MAVTHKGFCADRSPCRVHFAIPFAYYCAHSWLAGYEYRTELSWWIFLATGIVVLLITLLTVSTHVIKAATADPAKRLRAE